MIELEFVKPRGKEAKPNQLVNVEEFIAVKVIKDMGNQLTAVKIKNTNILEALTYVKHDEHRT